MDEDTSNAVQRAKKPAGTPTEIEIEGVTYRLLTEVGRELGISRQTLWRWRNDGKIPQGHRYRTGHVIFTAAEVEVVREYANRVEPIGGGSSSQLRLFNGQAK